MELISYPENYSSVFADNTLRFEQVDPTLPLEVSFVDDVVGLLGTKRFVGSQEVECSLYNYLHRRLNPQPLLLGRSAFVEAEGRNVRLTAQWDDGKSTPKITFTLAHDNLSAGDVVGGSTQRRTIAAGEVDEIIFVADRESNLSARLSLSTGEEFNIYTKTLTKDGLWAWVVDADEVIARSATPDALTSFSVRIALGTEELTTVTYTLTPALPDAVRLAWLDATGQICYHTFPHSLSREVESSASVAELSEGTTVLSKSGWTLLRLDSGVVAKEDALLLEGIVTSPRVWIVAQGVATPVVVLSSRATLAGSGRGVSLTLRPAKRTTYW